MLREHLTHGNARILEQDSPGSAAEVEPARSQLLTRTTSLPANLEVLSQVTASVSSGLCLWGV